MRQIGYVLASFRIGQSFSTKNHSTGRQQSFFNLTRLGRDHLTSFKSPIVNTFEKTFSVLAILFEIGLIAFLLLMPQFQSLPILLPASFVGLLVNTGLLFLVFRDIFYRTFTHPHAKTIWVIIILLFWPASIIYLIKHGFQRR